MEIMELLSLGRKMLSDAGIPPTEPDALLLLAHVLKKNRGFLYAHPKETVDDDKKEEYLDCIEKRSKRIPLQHITGEQDFMGLTFKVNGNVLVPRQDTEILVEAALKELHDGMRVLDLCTGSGCILISLLHYSNDCRGVGLDISENALEIAEKNSVTAHTGISFKKCDILSEKDWNSFIKENVSDCGEKFDIITSNPPYIPTKDIEGLMPEVKDHDPRIALDGGNDGLVFYKRIAKIARDALNFGGYLFLETGAYQAADVRGIFSDMGYRYIEIIKDYAGLDRVLKCIV